MSYTNYLHSSHWENTREEKLAKHPVCQVCGSNQSLHIHHKYYFDKNISILGREKETQLVTLCSSCHALTHRYFGHSVKKLNKKFCRIRRLMTLGVKKNKAFWIVATPSLYETIKSGIM